MNTQSIHMGHGQMVDIVGVTGSGFELAFSEAGKPDYVAPPLDEIRVDAIDDKGSVHPLAVTRGSKPSTVAVRGGTDGARRLRIKVLHGSHFHTREGAFPGAAPLAVKTGAGGGSLVPLEDGVEVEVTRSGPGRWLLKWLKDGSPARSPACETVEAEAIGPNAEDYQVRQLLLMPGSDPSTLAASGKIGDATHIRLTVREGSSEMTRSLPVL